MPIGLNRDETEQILLSALRSGACRLYRNDARAVAEAVALIVEMNNKRILEDLKKVGLLQE